MNDIFNQIPENEKRKITKEKQPTWLEPMLATLTDERFSDENWIFERKFDGERCLAFMHEGNLRLISRNQKSLNSHYPELIDAFGKFFMMPEINAADKSILVCLICSGFIPLSLK